MSSQIRKDAARPALIMVQTPCLGHSTSQHPPITRPNSIAWPINLVNRPWVPDEHISRHRSELQQLVLVILQTLTLNVYKHGLLIHSIIEMTSLEVHGSAILGRRFVHGDPKSNTLIPSNGSVLIVLMPFESLVRVDHEKIRRDTDFVGPATLREDVSHGGMVIKISEGLVRLPYVALDVIVELGRSASKCPEVRVGNLVACGGAEVFDPFGIEDALDVNYAILLESSDLILGEFVLFWRGDTRFDAVRQGEARVL
mmetsp:Transcript_21912/g.46259  ORF Transcript_21912/g.46259 Transcript_21912/m.46259 type:complete len:256 (-) Transcript_21912:436-1203(-)